MSENRAPPKWQTEELQEEWVDMDLEDSSGDEDNNLTYGTRSISLTAPITTHIHTNSDYESDPAQSIDSPRAVGTFLIREEVTNAPLLPKTPGRNKKSFIKDFFTPLQLERMFEPPSGPSSPAASSSSHHKPSPPLSEVEQDEIIETDLPNVNSFHGRKASLACQFTFSVPRGTLSARPGSMARDNLPQAQSTPVPPFVNNSTVLATDPRLRLFQFQYDTYTREHLSAMVDSLAINTPSAIGTGSTPSPTYGLSRVSETTGVSNNTSHLRSAKRIKLSPTSDFNDNGAGISITRPKLYGKDYVGESRSLMQQIKQARDFSTISTVAGSNRRSPNASRDDVKGHESDSQQRQQLQPGSELPETFLSVPAISNPSSSSGTVTSKSGSYSSFTYRQQAAALMAQIKSDMKGQKRIFSGDTDISHVTSAYSDKRSISRSGTPDATRQLRSGSDHRRTSSIRSNASQLRFNSQRTRAPTYENGEHSQRSVTGHRAIEQVEYQPAQLSRAPSPDVSSQPAPPSLAPPSHPSIRAHSNEDLNRFVSSSTASGTTLTAGSAPSFVKHAGPAHIRTIAPGDVPALPDRFGDMLFDKIMMKWVKATVEATQRDKSCATEGSDDPFEDIESLNDESRVKDDHHVQQQSEIDDDEEVELTSFTTDGSAHVVPVMTGIDSVEDDGETTDSADEDDLVQTITMSPNHDSDSDSERDDSHTEAVQHEANGGHDKSSCQLPTFNTPSRRHSTGVAGTPVIRSALKNRRRSRSPPSTVKASEHRKYLTPLHKQGHCRSVSFSDGKRDGPISGLHEVTSERDAAGHPSMYSPDIASSTAGGAVQSVRSKRIEDMLNALNDSDFDEDESPSKTSSSGRPEELIPLAARLPEHSTGSSSRRVFSRSKTHRASPARSVQKANRTFLTECSFAVTFDRLVQVITDVQPFEPHWEGLLSIDLTNKKLESVARLKEFLPSLVSLNLNSNELSWLSGVPASVRTLSVAHNCLTGITSYSHLLNIQNLDISYNDVESLLQLECLHHLRELKADGNKITSADGLQHMDGLVKLSLQGNKIQSLDFTQYQWVRIEMLNISDNRLDNIHGIASLQSLIALNLDFNHLGDLKVEGTMPRLRILRLSGNRLHQLQVGGMPNLRTLYADNNSLSTLVKLERLTKLENLSLRNQSGRGLSLLTREVRDVKRLYLSGNPLKTNFLEEPCYNLVYLEAAACRLTALPEGLSSLVPNLRVLNLNYNFLEDARPLEGLTRLQKLTMIGSRLKHSKPLIRLLQRMPEVEMLDFRMNPCTLGWYLPLLVKDLPGALQPSEGSRGRGGEGVAGDAWQDLDSKFRRDLPNESYVGRLAYRGLIMRACPRIRLLDGVGVTEKERTKADHLLQGLFRQEKQRKATGKPQAGAC